MTWRLFRAKPAAVPAVAIKMPAEPLTGRAKALDRKADEISRRNAKKTYLIGELAREISGLGNQLIDKFGENDR